MEHRSLYIRQRTADGRYFFRAGAAFERKCVFPPMAANRLYFTACRTGCLDRIDLANRLRLERHGQRMAAPLRDSADRLDEIGMGYCRHHGDLFMEEHRVQHDFVFGGGSSDSRELLRNRPSRRGGAVHEAADYPCLFNSDDVFCRPDVNYELVQSVQGSVFAGRRLSARQHLYAPALYEQYVSFARYSEADSRGKPHGRLHYDHRAWIIQAGTRFPEVYGMKLGEKKAALLQKWLMTFVLLVLALVMLFPIGITFTNSLMTEREIGINYDLLGNMLSADSGRQHEFVNLKLIPDWVSIEQFNKVLIQSPKFLFLFWNSVLMAVPIVFGQTAVAALAAYAFAMLRFPGRDSLFLIYIMAMLMPFQVTLVPNYIMADKLGILNSVAAIILPGVFATYGVFLLRQFMLHIPTPLLEAARLDGAGAGTIFVTIVLPLVKPGLAALTVLLFVDYWNMVEQPLIFLEDPLRHPLSVYLASIQEGARGVGFAASLLYMSPVVLLFLYAESYFVRGIQSSGIKG